MNARKNILLGLSFIILTINPFLIVGQESKFLPDKADFLIKLQTAIKTGDIRYKLTESEEIKKLLGKPQQESIRKDGGLDILEIEYPDSKIVFEKVRIDRSAPFTISRLTMQGQSINIGQNRKLVLRNNHDLRKLDRFWGLQNVSLKNLDLRGEFEILSNMPFDSYTEWPSQEKLPPDFHLQKLLEDGKNPGLGIRALHAQGITGKGIGIAILDQPLLLGHKEYTSRLIRYDATGLVEFSPQMHGSPISSIAVGKEIGVAPEATLSYFAVPMWESDMSCYTRSLYRIFELNKILPKDEIIRVVSISDGAFIKDKGFQEWQKALRKAEGKGIFVVTCDTSFIKFGTLKRIEGRDSDSPDSYKIGKYCSEEDVLRIPTGNKTIASYRGIDVYTYDREGGRSWAAPYIAGLAALAFQVNPEITPAEIKALLIKTVTNTSAGPIINPTAFIETVKKGK